MYSLPQIVDIPQKKLMLEYARAYHGLGWNVIPVHSIVDGICSCKAGDRCTSAGKHPRIRWTEYQEKRVTKDQVKSWWSRWPAANIGLITGELSGVIVLDVDAPAGQQTLREMKLQLPPTAVVETGSGGFHYFFRHPGVACRNFAGRSGETILPNVDFRGDGGLVVLPPSRNIKGEYKWVL